MFAKNLSKNNSKDAIKNNDQLIRFIFNYHYDFTVGKVTEAAFQIPQLERGLSVSVARLLNSQTRQLVIQSMENTSSKYVQDCLTLVSEVDSVMHQNTQRHVFDVELTPVLAGIPDIVPNPAHADIKFSISMQSLLRSEKKQYRWELMRKFNI
jgi:hypothetical protein